MISLHRTFSHARSQDGVTMIIVLGVMFVTSLLMAAAFVGAEGDIHLSHTDTTQKEAYYAALAGVRSRVSDANQPRLLADLWKIDQHAAARTGSSYKVKILPAGNATRMHTSNPLETAIE